MQECVSRFAPTQRLFERAHAGGERSSVEDQLAQFEQARAHIARVRVEHGCDRCIPEWFPAHRVLRNVKGRGLCRDDSDKARPLVDPNVQGKLVCKVVGGR